MNRSLICIALWAVTAGAMPEERALRGRQEGTYSLMPSNVAGTGNITVSAGLGGAVGNKALSGKPMVGAILGMGRIIQLYGTIIPFDGGKSGIGPLDMHVQLTTPGNDILRPWGIAVRGDMYLSTSTDTISAISDKERPEYTPHIAPALCLDADIIAIVPKWPFKMYLTISPVDNAQLLYRYDQISVKSALEYKGYSNTFFCEAGYELYKEKGSRLNKNIGDKSYSQSYGWIAPGGRYRLWSRVSLVGIVKATLFSQVKSINGITPDLFGIEARAEFPILYKETNTEAIRSMVFLQQKKQIAQDTTAVASGPGYFDKLGLAPVADTATTGESFDYSKERDALVKERQEIQQKMDAIEQMLEDTK